MAKRKETPDILAEILGGDELPPLESPPTAERSTAPAGPRRASARLPKTEQSSAPERVRKAPAPAGQPAAQELEYLLASFQYHRGWRPRFHNGRELEDWLDGPPVHEHIGQLAAQGWELVAASSGERMYAAADSLQLYFKRPKS